MQVDSKQTVSDNIEHLARVLIAHCRLLGCFSGRRVSVLRFLRHCFRNQWGHPNLS